MPRTRSSDGRKAAIIDAAGRLFGEHGYDAVAMDDIGAAVEISGPSLYWHFPGKQALFDAAVVAAAERFAGAFEGLLEAVPEASFEDFVELETVLMLEDGAYATTLLGLGDRLGPDALAAAQAARARSERVARATLARFNPSLDDEAAGVRLMAQVGPFVAVARDRADRRSRRNLGRGRLEALIVPSTLALAATPAVPRARSSTASLTGWRPRRSRREAILRGARGLFRDRGFEAVGVNDIGAAAGISGASVYHYFPGKTEILRAAWERETMRLVVGALAATERATSADDAVDRLARAYVEVILDGLDLVDVIYLQQREHLEPEGAWADNRRVLHDLWGSVLDEARPGLTEAERQALSEMCFGAAVYAGMAVGGNREWLDDIAAQVAAFAKARAPGTRRGA